MIWDFIFWELTIALHQVDIAPCRVGQLALMQKHQHRALAATRIEVAVPILSMYWYISAISVGVSAWSRGSDLATLVYLTTPAGISTF